MQRKPFLDILKVILAIFVIGAHGNFLFEYTEVLHFLFVNGIFRIAVPMFFIISGYFFVDVLKNNQFKKWIWRVIRLYLVWMLVYVSYWARLDDFHFGRFVNILFISGYHHLWYLIAMIYAGFSLFLLRRTSNKTLISIALLLFSLGISMQYIKNYNLIGTNLFNDISIYRNFIFVGLPFLIIGYLLGQHINSIKITKKQLIFILVISVIVFVTEIFMNYFFMPDRQRGFDFYFSSVLISTVLVFCALKLNFSTNYNSKNLTLYSTSIYLVHPLLMNIVVNNSSLSQTWITFATIFLSVVVSFFIVQLNKKIRIL